MQVKYDVRVRCGDTERTYQAHDVQADSGVLVIEAQGVTFWVPLHLITAPVEITKASVVS